VAAEAAVAKTRHETTTEAPVVEGSRTNDTVVVRRVQKKRDLRLVVMAAVGLAVALFVAGLIATQTGARPEPDVDVPTPTIEATADATARRAAEASPASRQTASGVAGPASPPREPSSVTNSDSSAARPKVRIDTAPTPPRFVAPAKPPPAAKPPPSTTKTRPGFDPSKPWEED